MLSAHTILKFEATFLSAGLSSSSLIFYQNTADTKAVSNYESDEQ